jgi:serine/threonine protein kinase
MVNTHIRCAGHQHIYPQSRLKEAVRALLEYGLAADIWSFGVVIFELFAGRTPFYDSDPSIMYSNIKEGSISWCPNMPHSLKSLISSILVVEPQSRNTIDAIRSHEFYDVILKLENQLERD